MSASVSADPERILKDLRKLWLDLAREDPNGVLRACTMTLIVFVDDERDLQPTSETIAALMHEHPSRTVFIRVRQSASALLEARVFAQCWKPFGSRQQICCEQVEILCSPDSLGDVQSLVRAITAPDLPVVLYAPSESLWPVIERAYEEETADKLIVDSCTPGTAAHVNEFLLHPAIRNVRKADLVWSRLTPLREAVSSIFDHPARRRSVYDLSEVQILYKAADEPSSVYYMAGWFMHVLGAGVSVKIARGVGPEYAGIAQVTIYGPKLEAAVAITGRLTAETTINEEPARVTVLPVANEYYAMRQELGVTGRDSVFEDVLGLANLMRGAG